jgi:hypothetical protein
MTSKQVFNQYYIDLIKRLKSVCKKTENPTALSKKIIRSIRENYHTVDKSSDEYITYCNENISQELWDSYIEIETVEEANKWFDDKDEVFLYKNVSLKDVKNLVNDIYLHHHFISVFYIFKNELSVETTALIIKLLQGTDKTVSIDEIEDEKIKKLLERLSSIRKSEFKNKTGIDMKGIENTTLGKLAKEILEDVDVEKLQKSIGENGDILKAIGNPDSGFADLITNVSKKMSEKISNGELKQENLLSDAMQFASIMPGLFGGGAGNGGAASSDQPNKQSSQPDMTNIMNMMSTMMGGMNGMGGAGGGKSNDMLKAMAAMGAMGAAANGGGNKSSKKTKTAFNTSAIKKKAAASKLRNKLNKRNQATIVENSEDSE